MGHHDDDEDLAVDAGGVREVSALDRASLYILVIKRLECTRVKTHEEAMQSTLCLSIMVFDLR